MIGFRQIELLLAHHGSFDQADRTVIVRLGLNFRCLGFFQIGSRRCHIGFGIREIAFSLQHSAFEQRRINLRDQLSLFDAGIKIHKKMRNRPRNLRADLNRDDGIDRPCGLHDLANITAIGLGSKVLRLVLSSEFKSDKNRGHDYDSDCD